MNFPLQNYFAAKGLLPDTRPTQLSPYVMMKRFMADIEWLPELPNDLKGQAFLHSMGVPTNLGSQQNELFFLQSLSYLQNRNFFFLMNFSWISQLITGRHYISSGKEE